MSANADPKGDVLITPLHWWSEVNREAAELAREAGKAYAVAIGGSQPTPSQINDLRRRLKRFDKALDKAERMLGGSERAIAALEAAEEEAAAANTAPPIQQPAAPRRATTRRSA